MVPARARPEGLLKCAWGWLGCALLQLTPLVPGPQASWRGGRAKRSCEEGARLSTSCLAWGQHSHCQVFVLEGTSSMMGLQLLHVSSCSTLSLLWLQLSRLLQRQSCVLTPQLCSSTEVCGEEPVALTRGWAECTPSHQPYWVSNPAPTYPYSYLLPSPASLPFTLSCLSLYPFLNSCLHCALKMQSAV